MNFSYLFQESLKNNNGVTSSKRLLGVSGGYLFLFIALLGSIASLLFSQWDTFLNILMILGAYSAALLNAGLLEKASSKDLGLGPKARTATKDRVLKLSASKIVKELKKRNKKSQ